MFVYRSMSKAEFQKFLDGKRIFGKCNIDLNMPGKVCMMPEFVAAKLFWRDFNIDVGYYGEHLSESKIFNAISIYSNLDGIVNTDVFVKFEIDEELLKQMIENGNARFKYTNYADFHDVNELQLDFYDNSFCKISEIRFGVRDFYDGIDDYRVYGSGDINRFNMERICDLEKIAFQDKGYELGYRNSLGGFDRSSGYYGYDLGDFRFNENTDSSKLLAYLQEYNELHGNVFTFNEWNVSIIKPTSVSQDDLSDSFVNKYYFYHSEALIHMIYDSSNEKIPEKFQEMLDAMRCSVCSDKTYSIKLDSESMDFDKLKYLETKNFSCKNLTFGLNPVWEITDKKNGEVSYLDTENLNVLLKNQKIGTCIYENSIINNPQISIEEELSVAIKKEYLFHDNSGKLYVTDTENKLYKLDVKEYMRSYSIGEIIDVVEKIDFSKFNNISSKSEIVEKINEELSCKFLEIELDRLHDNKDVGDCNPCIYDM